jgi:hypothetical protein
MEIKKPIQARPLSWTGAQIWIKYGRGRKPGLRRAYAKAIYYRSGSSSNSFVEFNGLHSQCCNCFGQHAPERSKELFPDSRNGLPRLGPLVWTRLCQGLWSVQMLVPSLLVKSRESGGRQRQAASVAKINR